MKLCTLTQSLEPVLYIGKDSLIHGQGDLNESVRHELVDGTSKSYIIENTGCILISLNVDLDTLDAQVKYIILGIFFIKKTVL